MEIETDEREVTRTVLYVTLNKGTDDEAEVEAARLLDVLEGIMGTDGFMTGVKHPDYHEKTILEALDDADLVGRSYSAGWHEHDEDAVDSLWERVMVAYHDDLDESDVDASNVR